MIKEHGKPYAENKDKSITRNPLEFYKVLDNNFENFFAQKEYTEKNFHTYIHLAVKTNSLEKIPNALIKMKELNIEPDDKIYSLVISSYAKNGKFDIVDRLEKSLKGSNIVIR
jgi:hypothetical protein